MERKMAERSPCVERLPRKETTERTRNTGTGREKEQEEQDKKDRRRQEEQDRGKDKEQEEKREKEENDQMDKEEQKEKEKQIRRIIQEQRETGQYAHLSDTSHLRFGDWELWPDREARPKKECGGNGEPFYPENEWGISDRQADDRARAAENAAMRQRHEWEAHGRDYKGAYPEPAITINTTRRYGGNQDMGGGKRKSQTNAKNIATGNLPRKKQKI